MGRPLIPALSTLTLINVIVHVLQSVNVLIEQSRTIEAVKDTALYLTATSHQLQQHHLHEEQQQQQQQDLHEQLLLQHLAPVLTIVQKLIRREERSHHVNNTAGYQNVTTQRNVQQSVLAVEALNAVRMEFPSVTTFLAAVPSISTCCTEMLSTYLHLEIGRGRN